MFARLLGGALKPGHLRRAFLRDEAARVPVNGGGKAQIPGHFVGRPAKRRESFFGKLHM
jgi:hypothetical protein